MMYRLILGLLLVITHFPKVSANPDSLRRTQISVNLDNDAYIPGRMDRYYSNGIRLEFNRFLEDGKSFSLKIGKEMYTPDLRPSRQQFPEDRPFAGLIYFEPGFQWRKNRLFIEASVLSGLLGPQSGVGNLHIWYHELAGFPKPEGWENQLPNATIGNLFAGVRYQLIGNHLADISLLGKSAFGNWDQSLQFGPVFRLGNLQPFSTSQITGSRVGSAIKSKEQYFQLTFLGKQSFWNGSVEGGNFKEKSGYSALPFLWEGSAELVLNFEKLGFSYGITFQSKNTHLSENHVFGKLAIHWLF